MAQVRDDVGLPPIPHFYVNDMRSQRAEIAQRIRADIERLEYIDTVLSLSRHASRSQSTSFDDVLRAVHVHAQGQAGYPEWTAVWMLCEELGLNYTPTMIIKQLEQVQLSASQWHRQKFYDHYFVRNRSGYYPRWTYDGHISRPTFDRMLRAAAIAYPMLQHLDK